MGTHRSRTTDQASDVANTAKEATFCGRNTQNSACDKKNLLAIMRCQRLISCNLVHVFLRFSSMQNLRKYEISMHIILLTIEQFSLFDDAIR